MKSKFVKRFLTMGLAAGLALSAVCGCAKQGEPADDAGKKEEGRPRTRRLRGGFTRRTGKGRIMRTTRTTRRHYTKTAC